MLSIEGNHEKNNIYVQGMISNPRYYRYDRNQIFLFVNQRWVKNHKLNQALIRGYQNVLQPHTYPAGFIFITLDTHAVDINIHPRKEEVQFLHPRIVEQVVELAVKQSLELYCAEKIAPNTSLSTSKQDFSFDYTNKRSFENPSQKNAVPLMQNLPIASAHAMPSLNFKQDALLKTPVEQTEKARLEEEKAFEKALEKSFNTSPFSSETDYQVSARLRESIHADLEQPTYRLIGQVLHTYIALETSEGIVLVDQHAAHERIIYEKMKKNFDNVPRIKLLFPQTISLTSADIEILAPYFPLFAEYGLIIEQLGPHEVVIQETPLVIKNQSIDDLLKQAIGWLHDFTIIEPDKLQATLREKIHAQISCKAAVKAGDELSTVAMHELIKDLYNTENRLTCPHGRPTLWTLSVNDIEKKFKRDYRS
jgi:DNA mismatch repair protein MutL